MSKFTKMDRTKLALISCILAVVTFLAVNIFSNTYFRGAEVDLTQQKLFTLSQGTKDILKNIDEPITIRMFVSKRLQELNPGHASYADRVRDLLERYVDL